MMKLICLFSFFLCLALCAFPEKNFDDEWEAYKLQFGKKYSAAEEPFRKANFHANSIQYKQHNAEAAAGNHSYTVGPNEYSDLAQKQKVTRMNGFRGNPNAPRSGKAFTAPAASRIPDRYDWRDYGVVTPVKNQGQCGSCWSFSTTGALEAAHARKTGNLVALSEQNLVDCSTQWGNNGCGGGVMDFAFKYIKDKKGLDTEKYYPYLGLQWYCFFNPDALAIGATSSGHVDIPKGNETALLQALATFGPIAVAIDATHFGFSNYKSGVYYDPACSSTYLDHAVLLVGYGQEKGQDYWLVKNSWGESYGDKGYIKMARNRGNNCGIASMASYPLV